MAPCIRTPYARAPCVRTQQAMAPCIRTRYARARCVWTQHAMAPCIRTPYARVPCVWTQLAMASAYWTERVRPFSFWTQPCQGIFLLDAAVSGQMASGRRVSWHHGHAVGQGTEHLSKYSCRIRKHAVGSRHCDSVQFYSFYLMYIFICYYHTSRGNKGKLANTTQRVEHDAMSTTR